ncbi:SAM-dependent methyltransferase [Actinomadura sp. CNU-125]|uniref:SAM-dependent methyltransferase n=1 Tax=Actinomadura sp. CNU-125 TaxID=1904961 RepID=UPI0021CCA8FA|nr:SAM-dependent methyltransferase [Actinomadura sp. CNU-125]
MEALVTEWLPWRTAMERALYGEQGFYRRGERPAEHFRTSVHASPRFAAAIARLLTDVDSALDHPSRLDLVDVGAGSGALLTNVLTCISSDLRARLAPTAVEIAPRPPGLPADMTWRPDIPRSFTGLAIANEWLDNIPLDVVEQTPDGVRTMLVDPASGAERPGPEPSADDRAWLDRWWPLTEAGDRAEVGRPRCAAWGAVLRRLDRGLAIAVDYAHSRGSRPPYGTLAGYRDGSTVPAVPDAPATSPRTSPWTPAPSRANARAPPRPSSPPSAPPCAPSASPVPAPRWTSPTAIPAPTSPPSATRARTPNSPIRTASAASAG